MKYIIKYECEEQPKVFYLQEFRHDGSIEWTDKVEDAQVFYSHRYIIDRLTAYNMINHLDTFASTTPHSLKTKLTVVKVP